MISCYPSITEEEFKKGCIEFEKKFNSCQDDGSLTDIKFDRIGLYIRQTRDIEVSQEEKIDHSEPELLDHDPVAQQSCFFVTLHLANRRLCQEALARQNPHGSVQVNFSLVLSPTYQVPVLWFALSQNDTPIMSLDKVYELLVAHASQDALRQVGVLGGISIADHPISNTPAFFIHPCRTPEILGLIRPDIEISPFEYLLLWLGVIGPSVGLYMSGAIMTGDQPGDGSIHCQT